MDHSVVGNSIMGLYKGCECKASLQQVTQGPLLLVDFWVLRTIVHYRDKTRGEWDHLEKMGEYPSLMILDGKSRDTESTYKAVRHLRFCAS